MFQPNLELAQDFLLKNARILERHLFTCLFHHGPREPVIRALLVYQNPDGGFGHGLEPDKRVPDSQPVDMEVALHTLDQIGALNDPAVHREILVPACEFLQSISTTEGGLPFTLVSASRYPHAPWWGGAPEHPPASINPTASIVGFLLKSDLDHPWLARAVDYCWQAMAASESSAFHDVMPMLTFLEYIHRLEPARANAEQARIAARVQKPGVVEFNPQAGGYVKMPLDWAPRPTSPLRRLFSAETLRQHLDALAQAQQPDGGWPIRWQPISPGVELEWRGKVTVETLATLLAYQAAW
jgi:hypothetical protein